MKKILTIIIVIISISTYSQDSTLDDSIKKMLKIQGIENNWNIVMTNLIQQQKEANPQINNDFWDRFKKEVLENSYTDFFNSIIPIYKKHLTEKEVYSILEFYQSDSGKSLISKNPLIIQESMEVGKELGEKISAKVIDDIEKQKTKNYDLINSGCSTFKEGEFKYQMTDKTFLKIKRDKKFQYEYYKGKTTKYKIKWLNDCRYTLNILKTNDEAMEKLKNDTLITNIYELGDEYYKFVSTIERIDFKLDGIIYKLK